MQADDDNNNHNDNDDDNSYVVPCNPRMSNLENLWLCKLLWPCGLRVSDIMAALET